MADLHHRTGRRGARNEIQRLGGVGGKRLLNQDRNPALDRADHECGVEAGRCGDDRRLETRVAQQRSGIGVGGCSRGDGERRIARDIDGIADRHDLGVGEGGEDPEMVSPHHAEADQADLHAGHALPPWRSTARRSEAATSSCSAAVIAANIGRERHPFASASVTGSATSRPRSLMYGCWLTGIG